MSVKSELNDLVEKAEQVLHDAEDLAVSERNRIGDLIAAVKGALVSLVEPAAKVVEKPAEKPKPAKASGAK